MKKNRSLLWSIVIILVTVSIAFIITYVYYELPDLKEAGDIANFSIGITSLIISVVALIIAFITYMSIDSVSAISSMEGNVLENEKYSMAYATLVRDYLCCESQQELLDQLCDKMIFNFKKNSKTCIEYADNIQCMIDHLLWFAYVDYNATYAQQRIDELVQLIEKKYSKLVALSTGNQYLLEENIRLIKYVLKYQDNQFKTRLGEAVQWKNSMLDIRGSMIANPISQIIYYDYLALEAMAKLCDLIKQKMDVNGYLFTSTNIKKIRHTEISFEDMRQMKFYVNLAKDNFEEAKNFSQKDILWQGYILYNLTRIQLLEKELLFREDNKKVMQDLEMELTNLLQLTKEVRYNVFDFVNGMCQDSVERISDIRNSFLLLEFEKECAYADILEYVYKASKKQLTKVEFKQVVEMKEKYSNLDVTIFNNVLTSCSDIIENYIAPA